MGGVFISYRRADSAYALLIYKALTQRFGRDRVFRDFEDIPPGRDFVAALDDALSQCTACVVVIGKGWLGALDRLPDPSDFVRREIAAVLKRNTFLLPCLVGGAAMPAGKDVPQSLAALLRKDAVTIGDENFDRDAGVVLDAVDVELAKVPSTPTAEVDSDFRQLRAVELLKRQIARMQVRAVELIEAGEIDRAMDELAEGLEVIMQLIEWSPHDLPLDLQLGYLYKTLGQAFDASSHREEADRYFQLTAQLFERLRDSEGAQSTEVAGALNGLGNVYYQRGDADRAIINYQRALALQPTYAYAWHDMLGAYLMKASKGSVDVAAMETALRKMKETGAGLPGLGAEHIRKLEAYVLYWSTQSNPTPTPARRKKKSRSRAASRIVRTGRETRVRK